MKTFGIILLSSLVWILGAIGATPPALEVFSVDTAVLLEARSPNGVGETVAVSGLNTKFDWGTGTVVLYKHVSTATLPVGDYVRPAIGGGQWVATPPGSGNFGLITNVVTVTFPALEGFQASTNLHIGQKVLVAGFYTNVPWKSPRMFTVTNNLPAHGPIAGKAFPLARSLYGLADDINSADVDVEHFGAIPDNTTDIHDAVQDAVNWLQVLRPGTDQYQSGVGGRIHFTGKYFMTGPINFKSGIHFYGDGDSTTIITWPTNNNLFVNTATLTSWFEFSRLGFWCNQTNYQGETAAISAMNISTSPRIRDCKFSWGAYGIRLGSPETAWVQNNKFVLCKNGIRIEPGVNATNLVSSVDVNLVDNIFDQNFGISMYVQQVNGMKISGKANSCNIVMWLDGPVNTIVSKMDGENYGERYLAISNFVAGFELGSSNIRHDDRQTTNSSGWFLGDRQLTNAPINFSNGINSSGVVIHNNSFGNIGTHDIKIVDVNFGAPTNAIVYGNTFNGRWTASNLWGSWQVATSGLKDAGLNNALQIGSKGYQHPGADIIVYSDYLRAGNGTTFTPRIVNNGLRWEGNSSVSHSKLAFDAYSPTDNRSKPSSLRTDYMYTNNATGGTTNVYSDQGSVCLLAADLVSNLTVVLSTNISTYTGASQLAFPRYGETIRILRDTNAVTNPFTVTTVGSGRSIQIYPGSWVEWIFDGIGTWRYAGSGFAPTAISADMIGSGILDPARLPTSVAFDNEVALSYASLSGNNVYLGVQTYNGPMIVSAGLTAGTLSTSNLLVGGVDIVTTLNSKSPLIKANGAGAVSNLVNGPDITLGLTNGNLTPNLVPTGITPRSYTNPIVTFDSNGRATAATNGTTGSSITANGTGPVTNFVNGPDIVYGLTNGNATPNLVATGIGPGPYTNATVTFDANGRAVAASSGPRSLTTIPFGSETASGALAASTAYYVPGRKGLSLSTSTTENHGSYQIPFPMTIVGLSFRTRTTTVPVPTGMLVHFVCRTNNVTDLFLSAQAFFDAPFNPYWTNNLSIPLNAGDTFSLKLITSNNVTWSTPPVVIVGVDIYTTPR